MHSFARHHHSEASKASTKETKGLVLNQGWRYDLMEWFHDTFSFRGKFRELRQRTAPPGPLVTQSIPSSRPSETASPCRTARSAWMRWAWTLPTRRAVPSSPLGQDEVRVTADGGPNRCRLKTARMRCG